MAELQKEIGDTITLFSPGRTFIKRGKLFKLSSTWKPTSHEREGRLIDFFLFSDLLLYISPTFIGRDKVVDLHIDADFNATDFVEPNCKSDALPLIAISTHNKVVYVQFESTEEEEEWMNEIRICSKNNKENRKSILAAQDSADKGSRDSFSNMSPKAIYSPPPTNFESKSSKEIESHNDSSGNSLKSEAKPLKEKSPNQVDSQLHKIPEKNKNEKKSIPIDSITYFN